MERVAAAPTTRATTDKQAFSVSPMTQVRTPPKTRKPTKWAWALYYLAQRPLFALEALNLYGDTCLHSTISDLSRRYGLVFSREWITHSHQHGGTTEFARYTLAPECRELAAELLAPFGLEVAA